MESRSLIGAFVVALALFAVFPFAIGKYQEVGIFRDALAERELLVQDRQAALDNFDAELNKYRTQLTGEVADKFAAMVPTTRSTAELISSIDALARESGITLAEVSFGEARQRRGETTNAVQISLQGEGTYQNFISFLSAVEQSVRLMDIQSFQVDAGEGEGTLRFDISLRAYFLQ
jgi:Tfp pilus assembly protein PilO